jgi:hypothetical protein
MTSEERREKARAKAVAGVGDLALDPLSATQGSPRAAAFTWPIVSERVPEHKKQKG